MLQEISSYLRKFLMEHRNDPFQVLEFVIDYSSSKKFPDNDDVSGMVPYLNMYIGNLTEGSVKDALRHANEEDDFDSFYDLFEIQEESEFDLELSGIFKPGESASEKEKAEFVATLRESLKNNSALTTHIETIFFHYVDEFDIIYF